VSADTQQKYPLGGVIIFIGLLIMFAGVVSIWMSDSLFPLYAGYAGFALVAFGHMIASARRKDRP